MRGEVFEGGQVKASGLDGFGEDGGGLDTGRDTEVNEHGGGEYSDGPPRACSDGERSDEVCEWEYESHAKFVFGMVSVVDGVEAGVVPDDSERNSTQVDKAGVDMAAGVEEAVKNAVTEGGAGAGLFDDAVGVAAKVYGERRAFDVLGRAQVPDGVGAGGVVGEETFVDAGVNECGDGLLDMSALGSWHDMAERGGGERVPDAGDNRVRSDGHDADDVGGECHRGGDGNFPCGLAEPVDVVQDAGGMAGGIEMGCDGQPQAEQPHVACGQGRPKVTQSGEQLGEHAYDRSWPDLSL